MTSYVVVLPSRYKPNTDECLASMAPEFREHVLLVDNSLDNRGVSFAWNLGAKKVLDEKLDWLIVLSEAITFNEPGGLDFIQALEDHTGHTVVEAMAKEGKLFGWHCLAFSRGCLERVGLFDINLPIHFGDLDYSLRIQKAYNIDGRQQQLWDKVPVDLNDKGMNVAAQLTGVADPAEPRIEYFRRKFGRHPGDYMAKSYDYPFNDPTKSWDYWPEISS